MDYGIKENEYFDPARMTVLIVDDTRENIDVLRRTLEPEGYAVSVALSGEQALKVTHKLNPDLILLDIMMDGIDGLETCRRLKDNAETQNIPVMFISAKSEVDDVVQGFEMGAVDYIFKPFRQQEVAARVKTHLKLRAAVKRLADLAGKDALTHLHNRHSFLGLLEQEMARYRRRKEPFALVFGDIDFFKKVNDTYGHTAGDRVLVEVSDLLQKEKRAQDIACRYGGEEFVIVLPETNLEGAVMFAEKLRCKVAERTVVHDNKEIQVTMSFGVGVIQNGMTLEQLIEESDQKLYQAKEAGRNRVLPEALSLATGH